MNRILVIDDELGISELIDEVLVRAGFRVDTAHTGELGIRRFDSAVFDLVVTDMGLPDMDGNGVIRHIRNSGRPLTPIIGISGTPWLLCNAACDAVLPKPFPLQALTERVQHLTRFRSTGASLPIRFAYNDPPLLATRFGCGPESRPAKGR